MKDMTAHLLVGTSKLMLQGIGAYVAMLLTLDELWWTYRRSWRYLTAGILALLVVGLLQWPTS